MFIYIHNLIIKAIKLYIVKQFTNYFQTLLIIVKLINNRLFL